MPWPTKKLGEIISFEKGKKMAVANDGEPYIGIDGLRTNLYAVYTQEKNGVRCKQDDVLLVWDGAHAGTVGTGLRGFVGSTVVKVLHHNSLENKFLFYLLKLFQEKIRAAAQGAAIPHLSKAFINNLKIPLPSLKIQKQIVERLDKITEAQKLNDGLIRKTEEFFQSLLHRELNPAGKNWEVKKLKEVCEELFAGGDVPKNNFSKIKTEKYFVPIFANGIQGKDLYGYTDIKKVTKPSITISARGTIGYPAIRTEAFYPIVRLIVLIPNSKIIDLHFLYYTTRNFNFFNTGTSIPQLTIPMIKNIKIPLPPFKTQKQIAAELSAAQEYKSQLLAQKSKLKELFDSVLSKSMHSKL